MDWSFANALSEKEQMRLWVETWKRAGPELERMKREELRAMTEEEALRRVAAVMNSRADDGWIRPDRRNTSGLVEQQRLFMRFSEVLR